MSSAHSSRPHTTLRSPTKPSAAGHTSASSPRSSRHGHGHGHPAPVVTASAGCFVSADARIEGTLNLGTGCVLHPRCAVLVGPGASLTMGAGCVVEENAVVRFAGPGTATLGSNNVFMVACVADLVADAGGNSMGSWNSFAPRSCVEGVRVGDQCTFAAGTATNASHPFLEVKGDEGQTADSDGDAFMRTTGHPAAGAAPPLVPSRTVVHGGASNARTWDGSGEKQEMALRSGATEYLREVLPKFNKQRAL